MKLKFTFGLVALALGMMLPYHFDDYFKLNIDFFILTEVTAVIFLWIFADRRAIPRQMFWLTAVVGITAATSWYLGNSPKSLRFVLLNYAKLLLLVATFLTIVKVMRDDDWFDRFMLWVVLPAAVLISITVLLDLGPLEQQFRIWKLHINYADYAEEFLLNRDARGVTFQIGSGILPKNFLVPGWSIITMAAGFWLAARKQQRTAGIALLVLGIVAAFGAPKRASVIVVAVFLIPNLVPAARHVGKSILSGRLMLAVFFVFLLATIVPSISTVDMGSFFRAPARFAQLGIGFGSNREAVDGRILLGFRYPAKRIFEDVGYTAFGRALQFEIPETAKIHSTVMGMLVALGFVGIVPLISPMMRFIRIVVSSRARAAGSWEWRVGVGLIAGAALHGAIDGFFFAFVPYPAWMFMFWLALGVGLVMRAWDQGALAATPAQIEAQHRFSTGVR